MTSPSPNLLVQQTPVSVAGLTSYIQTLLEEDDQLRQVCVIGEVSSANRHSSGLFFTLGDPNAKATISCAIWNSYLHQLLTLPVKGEQIIVLAHMRVYPPRGQYQLIVTQVLPAGEGLQALRYRQLRDRLAAEGLFDPQRKRTLPPHPQTIAVVTSPQAAAWGDIQRTLRRRYPGLQVLFSPAGVQGTQAAPAIVAAIKRVEFDGRAEVLILSRGGGAVEDLACFNDERVVKAIAHCPIPVIAGIGHQRDETLADLAADVCVSTPTAAAVQAVPELTTLEIEHLDRTNALKTAVKHQLQQRQSKLQQLRFRLRRLQLDRLLEQETEALTWKRRQLVQLSYQKIQEESQHCQHLGQKLATLDPHNVLQRGYAVVRQPDGTIIRSDAPLTVGEELQIQLGRSQVKVKITEILNSTTDV